MIIMDYNDHDDDDLCKAPTIYYDIYNVKMVLGFWSIVSW